MPALTGANSSSDTCTGACFAPRRALDGMPSVKRTRPRWARAASKCLPGHSVGPTVRLVADGTLAPFLLPDGFNKPRARAVLNEASVVAEAGRYALATREARRARRSTPYSGRRAVRTSDPVILVPGFMAGDATL